LTQTPNQKAKIEMMDQCCDNCKNYSVRKRGDRQFPDRRYCKVALYGESNMPDWCPDWEADEAQSSEQTPKEAEEVYDGLQVLRKKLAEEEAEG